MDGLLWEARGPINLKYAEAPELCPEAFMAKYGRHLVLMLASKFTSELLRKRVKAMSPSSMGLDTWGLQDLRCRTGPWTSWPSC